MEKTQTKEEKKIVNLAEITFKPSIAEKEITVDLHKVIAESIYQNASNLPAHSFALRLYESDGKIEVTDEEVKFIKDVLPSYKYFIQEAILKSIE